MTDVGCGLSNVWKRIGPESGIGNWKSEISPRFVFFVFFAVHYFAAATPCFAARDDDPRPNILLIMVDDLGKEWISCYGGEDIETPNIDALARNGMRLENAWCMPQCTPTRVTLLTGQYPFRHGWTNHWDVPRWGKGCSFDPNLNTSFGNVIRDAGYKTAAAGKWQIDDFRDEPDAMKAAGFDEWCMWTGFERENSPSGRRYWDPYLYTSSQKIAQLVNKDDIPKPGDKPFHTPHGVSRTYSGFFGPDIINDFARQFMATHIDQPFLLYYPMVLTHGPLTTTPDERNAQDSREKFSAMVRYTDKMVGQLVASLDELNIRDNTIIIFTTDNGSPGGIRNNRLGREIDGAKSKMNEAGTAIPFIVNCPGRVPEGVVSDALIDFTDILPTFAELSGGKPPEDRGVDGQSFAPLILGEQDDSPREWIMSMGGGPAVYSEEDKRVHPRLSYDDRVIRDKQYKLWVDTHGKSIKLFDMKNDPSEQNNLIDSDDEEVVAARKSLQTVIAEMPEKDASPIYDPGHWDFQKNAPSQ